jgi:hypothetical protein
LKVNRHFLGILLLLFLIPQKSECNDPPKFILIHLDAVSSEFFLQEMEKGNMPNIQEFFGDIGRIDYTITYFPSKTPVVISSIREGSTPRESALPGWKYTNEERSSKVGMVGSFLKMAFSKSRLSTTNLIYGLPVFNWMAGPALVNTAYYLKDYHVLQFYWYNIDTQGHFYGKEAYLVALNIFDEKFGKLVKRLDDEVNVIVYSDHGMTFGKGVEIDDTISELVGQDLDLYSYPTLYISDQTKKDYYARRLLEETELDFTFYEISKNEIKGLHRDAEIYFIKDTLANTIQYQFEGEDVFGFNEAGYTGDYLTRYEWLEISHNTRFPMAPVNIYYHLNNEIAGDILTLFEEDKYEQTGYSRMGNHGGFTWQDMTTPLLIRGSEVSQLYGKTYYWLPDLFNDIEGVNFDQRPPRDRHTIASRYDFRKKQSVTELSFSPIYRLKYGATFYNSDFNSWSDFDRVDIWGKADLFRSYLSRFWIGTGFQTNGVETKALLKLQYDITIRKLVLQNSFATNRPFYFRASYEATPWLAIETVNFTSLGLRFDF